MFDEECKGAWNEEVEITFMPLYTKLFILFFFIVFLAKYLIQRYKSTYTQAFLLLASLVFYAYANLKFIPILLGVGLITYVSGIAIRSRRGKLIAGIFIAIELLPIIAARAIAFSGSSLVIPLGISFFTLQAVTYTVSVYKGEMEAEKSPITILAFVTFFPAISSGPIQRAKDLIPLLKSPNPEFDYNQSTDGLKLMAWGLFKKLVIADNLALYIGNVRDPGTTPTGTALLVAAVLYSFQLYLDFSGYSDIAIGSANALGYDLKKNFDHPYLSRSVGEFWRRWHMSLSTWLRDYIYIPLGGSRKGEWARYRNLIITFAISGFWHGAGITWIVWGLYHGLCLCVENLLKKTAGIKKIGILPTFILVTFGWIIFSSPSLDAVAATITAFGNIPSEIANALNTVATGPDLSPLLMLPRGYNLPVSLIALLIYLMIGTITDKTKTSGLDIIRSQKPYIRWTLYMLLALCILFFGAENSGEFIYNRF